MHTPGFNPPANSLSVPRPVSPAEAEAAVFPELPQDSLADAPFGPASGRFTADDTMQSAAGAYAAQGWHVLALKPSQKVPHTMNGSKDATVDAEQIRSFWEAHPDSNIAIAAGPGSGLTVVDVDVKNGHRGVEELRKLEALHGPLPPTLVQRTCSGGLHYFFRYAAVKNSVSQVADGIDIQNDGKYVVVAPSVVSSGLEEGVYSWASDPLTTPIAAMPQWLVDLASSTHRPALSKEVLLTDGQRDQGLTRLAGHMRRWGLSEEVMVENLLSVNRHQCRPPLPESQVRKIARSIAKKAPSKSLVLQAGPDGELSPDMPDLSECGDAKHLVALFGDRFRWVSEEKIWIVWDGTRWRRDQTFEVQQMAGLTLQELQKAALKLPHDLREKVMKHALYKESDAGIRGICNVARHEDGVTVLSETLDADPDVINVLNGTIDLTTCQLKPHDSKDMLTKRVNIAYEQTAQAPTWRQFLKDVFLGDEDIVEFVQQCCGYFLTGSDQEQCFFLLNGNGNNGKTTFTKTIAAVLGKDYAVKANKETLLDSPRNDGNRAEPELMALKGKRFAYIDEVDERRLLNESRIKELTGGSPSAARNLYEGQQEFQNHAKLLFDVNNLPRYKGTDYGIARRPRVIPFYRKFEKAEEDPRMGERLLRELPGILAWMVEGCRKWRASGRLVSPHAVDKATMEYRSEMNHLSQFLEECFEQGRSYETPSSQVQAMYAVWTVARDDEKKNWQRHIVPFLEREQGFTKKQKNHVSTWLGFRPREGAQN